MYEKVAAADGSGHYEMRVSYSTSGSDSEISTDPHYVIFLEDATASQEVAVSEEDIYAS
ncbi:hypothetical protein [Methanolobus halotolerans]|uniref:hypothetical protein n=1 Tax=Methanolobus halotolerans TaxID=2052935 RepID=UPI0014369333|nr:hypothetical protein [Methanolobus halotolerans]